MSDKQFVDGLIVKAPRENAPDFVKCSISIRPGELKQWLQGKDEPWINIDVKESKAGKWYAEVNTWKPEQKPASEPAKSGGFDDFDDPIPFMRLEHTSCF